MNKREYIKELLLAGEAFIFCRVIKKDKRNSLGKSTYVNRGLQLIISGHAHRFIGNFPFVKQSFAARQTIIRRAANYHLAGGK